MQQRFVMGALTLDYQQSWIGLECFIFRLRFGDQFALITGLSTDGTVSNLLHTELGAGED